MVPAQLPLAIVVEPARLLAQTEIEAFGVAPLTVIVAVPGQDPVTLSDGAPPVLPPTATASSLLTPPISVTGA